MRVERDFLLMIFSNHVFTDGSLQEGRERRERKLVVGSKLKWMATK